MEQRLIAYSTPVDVCAKGQKLEREESCPPLEVVVASIDIGEQDLPVP